MHDELSQLLDRVASLEKKLEAHQKVVLDKSTSLERALEDARERAAELARSEEALRLQTGILNSILQSLSDGVVVADETGRFILFNSAAERILGIGATDATPDKWTERYG